MDGRQPAEPERGGGTVGKALGVLDLVAAAGRPVRFPEILAASPYPRPTLYRLVQTLVREGLLRHDAERQTYAPGLRLVRLAHAAWRSSSLAPIARPHLETLSAATGHTVHLAQLDGGQVLYLDKLNASRPVRMFSATGKVGPAYCTGVGKAMLAELGPEALDRAIAQQAFHRYSAATLADAGALRAELDRIRRDGHAADREEHEPGIVCVAVAIAAGPGRPLGAVSLTGAAAGTGLAALLGHLGALHAAAAAIAASARDWQFPEPG